MGGRGRIRSSSRGRSRGKIRSSSRGRRNVKQGEEAEEDRISNLPDDLINHILSYVHSNVAVQTMVLSKRWLNLWTTLSCLNFKRSVSSIYDIFLTDFLIIRPVSDNIYENLVRNFLKNRDEHYVLSKFKIDCDLGGVEMLTICLDYVRSHNVEYLSIRNGDLSDHHPCLFNSACLKTSLTSLYLEKVRIGKHVLEFENLKKLTLVRIDGDDMNITINCPKLQSLTLYPDLQHTFFVSAPSLLYLTYCSREVSGLFSERDGFPCIKQVHIGIKYYYRTVMKDGMDNFVSMLKAVRETPFLELSRETIEGLLRVPNLSEYEHSSLGNLKVLSLRGPGLLKIWAARTRTRVINYLLANSPQAKLIRKL